MGVVTLITLVLLSFACVCKLSDAECIKRPPTNCTSHLGCGKGACLGKPGEKVCRGCPCRKVSQCEMSSNGTKVQCRCNPNEGFFRDHCECSMENAPDQCVPNNCVHGECHNCANGYFCTCNPGWTGQNCDENIDECLSNPCGPGNCTDGVNSYECSCPEGFKGNCLLLDPKNIEIVGDHKNVSASTYGYGGLPRFAVDGIRSTLFHSNPSCYHSADGDYHPWWRVVLRQSYYIKKIVIYNRSDCWGCDGRLRGLTIKVGDYVCATYGGPATSGEIVNITCPFNGLYGDSVTIQQDSLYLTLCEVEVYSQ